MRARDLVHSEISFTQIGCFLTVGDTLNFSEAALMVGLSQPSVSRQIQNLERALKVRLLIRDRQRVELTQEGEYFYRQMDRLMKNFQTTIRSLKQ